MIKGLRANFQGFKDKLTQQNKVKIVIAVGIAGMLLIFLSEFITIPSKSSSDKKHAKSISFCDQYKQQIESELSNILASIKGVGKAKVMITFEGSDEYIYAQEITRSSEKASDKYSEDYKNNYVLIENGNEKEALVQKIRKPSINGVIIVCEGGDNIKITEKVLDAVSTVLNVPTSRICVAKG